MGSKYEYTLLRNVCAGPSGSPADRLKDLAADQPSSRMSVLSPARDVKLIVRAIGVRCRMAVLRTRPRRHGSGQIARHQTLGHAAHGHNQESARHMAAESAWPWLNREGWLRAVSAAFTSPAHPP